jgi:hypothetical protein
VSTPDNGRASVRVDERQPIAIGIRDIGAPVAGHVLVGLHQNGHSGDAEPGGFRVDVVAPDDQLERVAALGSSPTAAIARSVESAS